MCGRCADLRRGLPRQPAWLPTRTHPRHFRVYGPLPRSHAGPLPDPAQARRSHSRACDEGIPCLFDHSYLLEAEVARFKDAFFLSHQQASAAHGFLVVRCVPSSAICTYSKTKESSSLWSGDATGADTPPTSTGSSTSLAPPDMGVVWGAVSYIEKELKIYRTPKNPQNQKKSESSRKQNDDEKATNGSLTKVF